MLSSLVDMPKKWRIVVITETWTPEINGVAHTIQKMVEEMIRGGHEVILIRPRQSLKDTPSREKRFKEYLMPSFRFPWYKEVRLGFVRRPSMFRLLRDIDPDLVQVVTEGILGRAALLSAKELNLKVVSEYHTNFDQYVAHYHLGLLASLAKRYLRHLHNQADKVLVPTKELKEELESQEFQNLHVVSRGLDTEQFHPKQRSETLRQQWGLADNELAVVYVGRIAAEKNLGLAVRAFQAIQQQREQAQWSKAQLIFVGDGPERKRLEQQYPEFLFCGMQTGQALSQHYASGDLFLSPSLSETFGNTILEAMASQLAIVCFNYAAAKEYLRYGENGFPVTFGDENAFIENAVTLAQNKPLREQFADQARKDSKPLSWRQTFLNFQRVVAPLIDKDLPDQGDHYEIVTSFK